MGISREEYTNYQNAIFNFLSTQKSNIFSSETFVNKVVSVIVGDHKLHML